jgi:hypothetical protein
MRSVDGVWWDSQKTVPDWQLTLRRHFEVGSQIHGWRVSEASAAGRGPRFAGCDGGGEPLVLRHPDGFEGVPFEKYVTYEAQVGDELVAAGFPLPVERSRSVTQADFPAIVEQIRRENAEQMGPDADRP